MVVERPLGLILVLEGQRGIDFHMQAHVVLTLYAHIAEQHPFALEPAVSQGRELIEEDCKGC